MYVTDTAALAEVCARLRSGDAVGIDTEFMRERTYYAKLCLVQLSGADEVIVVDPLAEGIDLAPLGELLADRRVTKVMHAGIQDLEIFYQLFGQVPGPVFDTQVAATLAGFQNQVGYATLVHGMIGATVSKGERFTDWARRPLSDKQRAYAAEDVRHLLQIHRELRDRLAEAGRLEWLRPDFDRLEAARTYVAVPEEQFRRVKRASSLNRRHLGVLMHVTAWREREAQRRDVPRRRVLMDEALLEIARRTPRDAEALAAVRGVEGRLSRSAEAGVLEAVARGVDMSDSDLPTIERRRRREPAEGVTELMSAFVRIRSHEHHVAAPLLASRDDLEGLAAGEREGSPLLEGWRNELVGRDLVELLEGRMSLRVTERGVVADRRPTDVTPGR